MPGCYFLLGDFVESSVNEQKRYGRVISISVVEQKFYVLINLTNEIFTKSFGEIWEEERNWEHALPF